MPLELFPYQEEGAAFLASRRRAGLHDVMGLGKTAQAVRACDLVGAKRIVVVCPAMLRQNWIKEFRQFSRMPRKYCKGETVHDFVAWSRGRYDVLVTSYEMATKWAAKLYDDAEILDAVITDEAHFLKNSESKRTKALFGDKGDGDGAFITWAVHTWHLTGTPMANDPIDIYAFLKFVEAIPASWTVHAFRKRYFHSRPTTYSTRNTVREDMLAELRHMITNNAIRRTKEDVGLQLPPIWLTSVLVDGSTDAISEMLAEHPGLEDAILYALEQGGLSFIDSQYVATLRRLLGEAKAIPYAHMLLDELRAGAGKRVVFGIHKDALRTVQEILSRHQVWAVLVNGETKEVDRVAAVEAFQTDERCRVFLGNIRAAGTGLTLTAASDIDVMESDWSPAGNAQAIMRVHRIGQTASVVRARFITLAGTFDEVVNRVVAEKTRAIAAIDGNEMHAAPPLDDFAAYA